MFKKMTFIFLMVFLVQCLLGGMAIPGFAAATTIIISDTFENNATVSSPGYTEAGTGWANSGQSGYTTGVRYSDVPNASAIWTPTIAADAAGKYRVSIYRANSTLYDPLGFNITVTYNGGSIACTIDMASLPVGWVDLGVFDFGVGTAGNVKLTSGAVVTSGKRIIAESVKFEPVAEVSGAATARLLTNIAYTSTPVQGVATTSPLTLNFSQTMDVSTLTSTNIQLVESGSRNAVPINALSVTGGNVVTITPTSPLTVGKTYTVVIGDGVKDSSVGFYAGIKGFVFRTTNAVINASTGTSPKYVESTTFAARPGPWGTTAIGDLRYISIAGAYATYKPGIIGKYQLIFNNATHPTAASKWVRATINFNGGSVTKDFTQYSVAVSGGPLVLGTFPLDSNSTIVFTNRDIINTNFMRLEKLTFNLASDFQDSSTPTVINAFTDTSPKYVESGTFLKRGSSPWGSTTIGDLKYNTAIGDYATYKPGIIGKYKIMFINPLHSSGASTNIGVTVNYSGGQATQTLTQFTTIGANTADYVDLGDYTLDVNSTVVFKNNDTTVTNYMRLEKLYFFPILDDYKITPTTFKNGSDVTITSMAAGTVKVSLPITNTKGSNLNTCVVFANYNSENKLMNVVVTEKAIENFTEENYKAQFNCASGDKIKGFVWGGISTIKPILLSPSILQ